MANRERELAAVDLRAPLAEPAVEFLDARVRGARSVLRCIRLAGQHIVDRVIDEVEVGLQHLRLVGPYAPGARRRVHDQAALSGDARYGLRAIGAERAPEPLPALHVGVKQGQDGLVVGRARLDCEFVIEIDGEVQGRPAALPVLDREVEKAPELLGREQVEDRVGDHEVPLLPEHAAVAAQEIADLEPISDGAVAGPQLARAELHARDARGHGCKARLHPADQGCVAIDEGPLLRGRGQARGQIQQIGPGARAEIQDAHRRVPRGVLLRPGQQDLRPTLAIRLEAQEQPLVLGWHERRGRRAGRHVLLYIISPGNSWRRVAMWATEVAQPGAAR